MIYTRLSSPSSFQSTAPVWGPTPPQSFLPVPRRRISIHGPRVGADDISMIVDTVNREISIHGPRVGADPASFRVLRLIFHFNPRPPCGGRPGSTLPAGLRCRNFNPRPPCGGRLAGLSFFRWLRKFQSTAPVWGPTERLPEIYAINGISIHGPRVGADPPDWLLGSGDADFNPRPPCGGRRLEGYLAIPDRPDFNPRPPCGGRLNSSWLCWARELFQSTAPVWGPTRSSVDSN